MLSLIYGWNSLDLLDSGFLGAHMPATRFSRSGCLLYIDSFSAHHCITYISYIYISRFVLFVHTHLHTFLHTFCTRLQCCRCIHFARLRVFLSASLISCTLLYIYNTIYISLLSSLYIYISYIYGFPLWILPLSQMRSYIS